MSYYKIRLMAIKHDNQSDLSKNHESQCVLMVHICFKLINAILSLNVQTINNVPCATDLHLG